MRKRLRDTSNKTRIETIREMDFRRYIRRLRDTSNKTRIETEGFLGLAEAQFQVSEILPIKQGLKLKNSLTRQLFRQVSEILPIKQGLKQNFDMQLAASIRCLRDTSNKTSIETRSYLSL